MTAPLCIDVFCGVGGWAEGFLAEGWQVIGFDIERHVYGEHRYPSQLVIQDALTLDGRQFKDADCLVMSPPCQEYSYMAMPWSLGKAKAAAIRADATGAEVERLNRLFSACFRIQREACEAAGHHIPLIVENVRGAIPWVGRSRWNFGSFHLWGDVPALMPIINKRQVLKAGISHRSEGDCGLEGTKVSGLNWSNYGNLGYKAQGFNVVASQRVRELSGQKLPGNNTPRRWEEREVKRLRDFKVDDETGVKQGGDWFSNPQSHSCRFGSKTKSRKAAAALIAKIPLQLSRYIAATFHPKNNPPSVK